MKKLNKKKQETKRKDYKSLFLAKIIQSIPDNYLMTFFSQKLILLFFLYNFFQIYELN